MADITVEIQGFDHAIAALNQLLGWKHHVIEPVGHLVLHQHEERILHEKTDPDGAAWAELAPETVRKKGSTEILIDTMAMAGAFELSAGGDIVRLSNPTPYGHYHQGGTTKMPARAFMGFSEHNVHAIENLIRELFAAIVR